MERVLPPRRLFHVPFEQDKWQLEKMRKKDGKKFVLHQSGSKGLKPTDGNLLESEAVV